MGKRRWEHKVTMATIGFRNIYLSPYQSIASTFWWSIVTMTTVGYGDAYPVSPAGKFVACVTMFGGILVERLCFLTIFIVIRSLLFLFPLLELTSLMNGKISNNQSKKNWTKVNTPTTKSHTIEPWKELIGCIARYLKP